jgi:site-specific recombinase XerD
MGDGKRAGDEASGDGGDISDTVLDEREAQLERSRADAELPSGQFGGSAELPQVLLGHSTPAIEHQLRSFLQSVAAMFDAWLNRRENENTRRAYRADVLDFVAFQGIRWPRDAEELLRATVPDVQAWRDFLRDVRHAAPKTLNRKVSSVSCFFKFMREAAAEARLPILVPNPAHAQFLARESQDPVDPTHALSVSRAQQLMALPKGDDVLAARDRAILKFYLYTGARIGTGCRLRVEDFHVDDDDATIKVHEKGRGRSKRAIGLHFAAAEAMRDYLQRADLTSGPLFRARASSRAKVKLSSRPMDEATMYRLLMTYLSRLPKAMREVELPDGGRTQRCIYTPHSLRATTATLLLDAGVEITEVQQLLGHKHVTVTQVYDKRRRSTRESASHKVPL